MGLQFYFGASGAGKSRQLHEDAGGFGECQRLRRYHEY